MTSDAGHDIPSIKNEEKLTSSGTDVADIFIQLYNLSTDVLSHKVSHKNIL